VATRTQGSLARVAAKIRFEISRLTETTTLLRELGGIHEADLFHVIALR
jgi:hypothetical protein